MIGVRASAFWLCSLPGCRLQANPGATRSRFASTIRLLGAKRTFLLIGLLLAAAVSGKAFTPKHPTLQEVFGGEIGVREATGRNDGPRVAEYLRYCGLAEGHEWCAAFVSWCHGQAGHDQPRNAWAAALFPEKRVVWTSGLEGTSDASRNTRASSNPVPRPGDVFGIYVPAKKRIGHCGFVDAWDGTLCTTVEGNVDNAVIRKRRPVRTIQAVSRWMDW